MTRELRIMLYLMALILVVGAIVLFADLSKAEPHPEQVSCAQRHGSWECEQLETR